MESYVQITFEEALDMILKKDVGNLYHKKHGDILPCSNYNFNLERLSENKWFKKYTEEDETK